MNMRGPIRRTRQGDYKITFAAEERDLIRTLPTTLRALVEEGDPSLARLFPPAYLDHFELDREYGRLMREELVNRRLESMAIMAATIDADRVSEDQLMAWLKVINDVRLVLGTILDVSEDDELDPEQLDPSDPKRPLIAQYLYLLYLLHVTLTALDRD